MTDEQQNLYRAPAVAILVAGVAAEAARLLTPWPGFAPEASRVVSVLLIVLWSTAAIAIAGRDHLRALANSAWAIAMAAALAMFVHGAVTRVGGGWLGLWYLPAAAALGFLLKRSFLGRRPPLARSRREREQAGTPRGAQSTV